MVKLFAQVTSQVTYFRYPVYRVNVMHVFYAYYGYWLIDVLHLSQEDITNLGEVVESLTFVVRWGQCAERVL